MLLSEVMSQQTQLDRVVPKWEQFLERYPTPNHMAQASVGEIIAAWVGLGYNRRARMLHELATTVVAENDGQIPSELDALLALPGIGPYTARAVLAFAFEHDIAVVDTNVGRVLARLAGERLGKNRVQALADSLVPVGAGWEWNQALLDFGASICTKRQPSCESCPVRQVCSWRGFGADPAVGSAAVSAPQSAFVGSDRQGGARLVSALRHGDVKRSDIAGVMGWPDDEGRVQKVLERLERDGLVVVSGDTVRLP